MAKNKAEDQDIPMVKPNEIYTAMTGLLPDGKMSLLQWLPPTVIQPPTADVSPEVDSSLRYWPITLEEIHSIVALKKLDKIVTSAQRSGMPSDAVLLRF